MLVRGRVDQLGVDADPTTDRLNSALEDIARPQFPADLSHVLAGVCVLHHGSARNDPERLQLSEPGEQIVV